MAELKCWLACGADGQIRVYSSKPERSSGGLNDFGGWRGSKNVLATAALFQLEQCGLQIPMLTYSDDPVELTISLNYEPSQKE